VVVLTTFTEAKPMSAEVNPEDTITTVKLNIVVNAAEVRLKKILLHYL